MPTFLPVSPGLGRRFTRSRAAAGCLFSLLATALPAAGQPASAPDTTFALPAVTVTAARAPLALVDAPTRVTLLDERAIAASGASSAAELLEARSGAFVRRYGPTGLANLALRGGGASQTLLLLDGRRLNDPQLGQVDLTLLPTALLASAEIVHGPTSALYGSDGLNGAVHLRTPEPADRPSGRLHLAAGAWNARRTGGLVSSRSGRLAGLVAAEFASTDGDFSYRLSTDSDVEAVDRITDSYDEMATDLSRTVEEIRAFATRVGADRRQGTVFATIRVEGARRRLTLGAWLADAERGLPGPGTQPPRGERQWDRTAHLWTSAEASLGRNRVRIGGDLRGNRLRYLNPVLRVDDTGRSWSTSAEATVRRPVGARHLLTGGLSAGASRARHPQLRPGAVERRLAAFLSGWSEIGRLLVYPALRLDRVQADDASAQTAFSPHLGLNLRPLSNERVRLKLGGGRAFRSPTLNQRFWGAVGDPSLRPETAWSADAGLMIDTGLRAGARARATAEVGGFVSRVRDQIVWQPDGAVWRPLNLRRVRTFGLQASTNTRWQIGRRLRLDAGGLYTFTDARDRSDPGRPSFGRPVRYVPRHQLKAHAGVAWRRLSIDADARRIGRRFVTTDGRDALPAYRVVDGQIGLRATVRGIEGVLRVRLENILDADYTVIADYPMPPRHAELRLTLELP